MASVIGSGEPLSPREAHLLQAARGGDTGAFTHLVLEAAPTLERLALRLLGHRHDAEDVAQDTVLAAYRALPRFRGESRFKTWICRILVRRALDLLRRRRPVEIVADDALPAAGDRLRTHAILTLCMQVFYRYDRVYLRGR